MEKKKCGQRHILLIFLSRTNRTLQKIRSYFLIEQDYAEEYKPAVRNSPLQGLEKHAAMICTKKIYLFFLYVRRLKQIKVFWWKLILKSVKNHHQFLFREINKPNGEPYYVTVDMCKGNFKSSCLKLESEGVLCRHIISSFKNITIT